MIKFMIAIISFFLLSIIHFTTYLGVDVTEAIPALNVSYIICFVLTGYMFFRYRKNMQETSPAQMFEGLPKVIKMMVHLSLFYAMFCMFFFSDVTQFGSATFFEGSIPIFEKGTVVRYITESENSVYELFGIRTVSAFFLLMNLVATIGAWFTINKAD
jgi:hypothetical protein